MVARTRDHFKSSKDGPKLVALILSVPALFLDERRICCLIPLVVTSFSFLWILSIPPKWVCPTLFFSSNALNLRFLWYLKVLRSVIFMGPSSQTDALLLSFIRLSELREAAKRELGMWNVDSWDHCLCSLRRKRRKEGNSHCTASMCCLRSVLCPWTISGTRSHPCTCEDRCMKYNYFSVWDDCQCVLVGSQVILVKLPQTSSCSSN